MLNPEGIYLLKVNNRNTRTRCKICSELIKTLKRCHWRRSRVFIVNFEHISHFFLVFLLLTSNMQLPAGIECALALQKCKLTLAFITAITFFSTVLHRKSILHNSEVNIWKETKKILKFQHFLHYCNESIFAWCV